MSREADEPYRILVYCSKGNKCFYSMVLADESIFELKTKIWRKSLIPPRSQKLTFQGQILADYHTVKKYGIVLNSLVELVHIRRTIDDTAPLGAGTPGGWRAADLRIARALMRPSSTRELYRWFQDWEQVQRTEPPSSPTVISGPPHEPSTEPLPTPYACVGSDCVEK
jgi:hypothetical protein